MEGLAAETPQDGHLTVFLAGTAEIALSSEESEDEQIEQIGREREPNSRPRTPHDTRLSPT